MKHHLANARSNTGALTTAQLVWILAARLPEPERLITDVADVATHVSPMSRLMTMARPTGFEPASTHPGLKSIPIEGADDWEVATISSA